MKKFSFIALMIVSIQCLGQISGRILNEKTRLPISYVNVWIEKSWEGTTSDENGNFYMAKGQVGDTLLVSHLGYQKLHIIAKDKNEILLPQSGIQLEEVVILPRENNKTTKIKSYKNYKAIREFNFFEHQTCARYFEYNDEYAKTPFIKNVSLTVFTPLNRKQLFRVYLMKTDKQQKPSDEVFSEYKNMEIYGDCEVNVDFTNETLLFPKEGFFVVFDILNLKENVHTDKSGYTVLCPAIGMENIEQKKNTWLSYHGKWIAPIERQKKDGYSKNVAMNLELSN